MLPSEATARAHYVCFRSSTRGCLIQTALMGRPEQLGAVQQAATTRMGSQATVSMVGRPLTCVLDLIKIGYRD